MGKPVGSRFGQMVIKSQAAEFRPKTICTESSICQKWARRPKTGIKECFEEMEHEFPYGHSKQDYLFRCYGAPRNFPLEQLEIVMFHFIPWLVFLETFCKW